MESLLAALLSGQLGLPEALEWCLLSSSAPPPILLEPNSTWERRLSPGQAPLNRFTPADFRVFVLNYVREQAELILAAAEQDGSPSHPPTPEGQEKAASSAAAAARDAPAPSAPLNQQQQRQAQGASQQRQSAQPGALDDDNFPALGAPAPKGRASPAAKPKAARRNIMPAKVDIVNVDPSFVAAAPQPAAAQPAAEQAQVALPLAQRPSKAATAASATIGPISPSMQQQQQQVHHQKQQQDQQHQWPAARPPQPSPRGAAAVAAGGLTPAKRKIIPTKVAAVEVNQSFLVSPSLAPHNAVLAGLLQGTTTPQACKTAGGGALQRSPLQLQELARDDEELRCQLAFNDTPSKGRTAASHCVAVGPALGVAPGCSSSLPESLPASLVQRLTGVSLSSSPGMLAPLPGKLDGSSAFASGRQAPQQQQPQQSASGQPDKLTALCQIGAASPGADPSPMERLNQRLGSRLPAGATSATGFDAPSQLQEQQGKPSPLAPLGGSAAAGAASPSAEAARRSLSPQKRPSTSLDESPDPSAPPAAQLSDMARVLAELHAGLLRCCSSINLAAELDLLLNLLAVPTDTRIDPALTQLTPLWCGELAQQYACCVLQSAGWAVRGLGQQLLQDLSALPIVRASFPHLHSTMQLALQQLQSLQLHTEKAYLQVKSSSLSSLFGLPVFTSDGRKSRTPEEQRRISNRESCRDEWFNLMKQAAAQTHSFAARQLSRAASASLADPASESGQTGATSAGDEASALLALQQSAGDLLRRLRPDNFGAFAELFTAAVLQAAATGETILDEELTNLAKKNVSRFHRLNQRLQGQGAAGPSRGGAARLQHNQPMTAAGFGPISSSIAGAGRRGWRQPGQPAGGWGRQGSGRTAANAGIEESIAAALAAVLEFPRAQRLYVLFLEAADSHRLNSSLVRCMTARLRGLQEQAASEHAAGAALSDKVVAMSTLASFLSYLCFARGGAALAATSDANGSSSSAAYDGSHPVDALAALQAAAADGCLPMALPWAVRYLWFLRPAGTEADMQLTPYFLHVLSHLAELHGHTALAPQDGQFGLAALCLRCLLDDFVERMGPDLMASSTRAFPVSRRSAPDNAGGSSSQGGTPGSQLAAHVSWLASLDSLSMADGLLDSRYLHLCCPTLEHARQLFRTGQQTGAAGAGSHQQPQQQQQQARRVKKIRPTAPSAARAALQVPASLQSAASGGQDLLKLKLQRAFLEQYSTDAHKVKLKELVDYVADVIACNAASWAASQLVGPALEASGAELLKAAEDLVPALAASAVVAGGPAGQAGASGSAAADNALPPPRVESAVRQYLCDLGEQLIASSTGDVLQRGQAMAERQLQENAVRALVALAPFELGEAVIGTAAAIAAEVAGAACAQRLLAQVPSAIRQGVRRQIDAATAAFGKASKAAAVAAGRISGGR